MQNILIWSDLPADKSCKVIMGNHVLYKIHHLPTHRSKINEYTTHSYSQQPISLNIEERPKSKNGSFHRNKMTTYQQWGTRHNGGTWRHGMTSRVNDIIRPPWDNDQSSAISQVYDRNGNSHAEREQMEHDTFLGRLRNLFSRWAGVHQWVLINGSVTYGWGLLLSNHVSNMVRTVWMTYGHVAFSHHCFDNPRAVAINSTPNP